MPDVFGHEVRSRIMASVRGRDTKPELLVRKAARSCGFTGYRLCVNGLPGRPDLVFRSRKKAIFVHGCFWHMHGCGKSPMPKSNKAFWSAKLFDNVARDVNAEVSLERLGWRVLAIWECQTANFDKITKKIERFLSTCL